ncbi:MAG: response regulator [Aureliella sp.]
MPVHTVLDVGNCVPDHASIKRLLTSHFDVDVLQTHASTDTLALLRQRSVDLVLINRKLDCDYSDGTEILKQLKSDPVLAKTPVMIISNYAEHQDSAVALGAERGFGKLELQDPATQRKLSEFLAEDVR